MLCPRQGASSPPPPWSSPQKAWPQTAFWSAASGFRASCLLAWTESAVHALSIPIRENHLSLNPPRNAMIGAPCCGPFLDGLQAQRYFTARKTHNSFVVVFLRAFRLYTELPTAINTAGLLVSQKGGRS